VTFLVHGNETEEAEKICGHKIVLACASSVFSAMFSGGMREVKQSEVEIFETRPSIFKKMLTYLYTEECEIDGDNVSELLWLANEYNILRLKQQCESMIAENLSLENAFELLKLAESLDAFRLRGSCIKYLASRLSELGLEQLQTQDPELFEEILYANMYLSEDGGILEDLRLMEEQEERLQLYRDEHDVDRTESCIPGVPKILQSSPSELQSMPISNLRNKVLNLRPFLEPIEEADDEDTEFRD